jgi:hypothetical protein
VLERFVACTLIECALETGRTHQIRVHMTAIGHPLVGDPTYGSGASRVPKGPPFPRQALHACRLALLHPADREGDALAIGLPDDMAALLESLRRQAALACAPGHGGDGDADDEDAGMRRNRTMLVTVTTRRTMKTCPSHRVDRAAAGRSRLKALRIWVNGEGWIVPDWPAPASVRSLITTRRGGVSLPRLRQPQPRRSRR